MVHRGIPFCGMQIRKPALKLLINKIMACFMPLDRFNIPQE